MSPFGTKYLVDTNALSQLRLQRRSSAFFQASVKIPSEVLHEAEGFPDIEALRQLEYPVTASVLRWLQKVMATVPDDDTALVDLYANHGSADPLMVACALDARDKEADFLDSNEWVIVTDDRAVRSTAARLGLSTLSNAEFADLIDREDHEADARQETRR